MKILSPKLVMQLLFKHPHLVHM